VVLLGIIRFPKKKRSGEVSMMRRDERIEDIEDHPIIRPSSRKMIKSSENSTFENI